MLLSLPPLRCRFRHFRALMILFSLIDDIAAAICRFTPPLSIISLMMMLRLYADALMPFAAAATFSPTC